MQRVLAVAEQNQNFEGASINQSDVRLGRRQAT